MERKAVISHQFTPSVILQDNHMAAVKPKYRVCGACDGIQPSLGSQEGLSSGSDIWVELWGLSMN